MCVRAICMIYGLTSSYERHDIYVALHSKMLPLKAKHSSIMKIEINGSSPKIDIKRDAWYYL